jgi:hypothetical protein
MPWQPANPKVHYLPPYEQELSGEGRYYHFNASTPEFQVNIMILLNH